MSEGLIDAAMLCKLLDVNDRTLRKLAQDGVVERVERGRYSPRSVPQYVRHLREVAAGRGGEAAGLDLARERARLAKAQADDREMRNAQTRGELIPAAEVTQVWSDVLRGVRSGVLAVSSRVRQRLPHLTAHDAEALDGELRRALEAIVDDK